MQEKYDEMHLFHYLFLQINVVLYYKIGKCEMRFNLDVSCVSTLFSVGYDDVKSPHNYFFTRCSSKLNNSQSMCLYEKSFYIALLNTSKTIDMRTLTRLCFLLLSLCTPSLFAQTPNVVVIIADDMGWSQISTGLTNLNHPSDFYETPHLDAMASQGIAFPYGYVNGANCAPTRSAILSGQYASRPHNNIWAVDNLNRGGNNTLLVGPSQGLPSGVDELPTTAITIAETMKTAGYATVHLGKFHVGEDESTNTTNNAATDQGFDVNYGGGTKGNPGSYFASSSAPYTFNANIGPELDVYAAPYTAAESLALAGDNSLTGTKKHVTDAMADAAIDWMELHKTNPFFMHFSNYAIHGPFNTDNGRPDLVAKYQAKPPSQIGHNSIGQAAIAEGMDQTIGRLVDYLKTTADPRNPGFMLSENTLVYFISDNGGAISSDDSGPLRAMKGELYEGGIRSITIAWSEASWLANKGTVNTTPVMAFDLYPTIAELGGASLPGAGYPIDGVSQWQMLTNGTALNREALYWHFPGYLIDSKRNQRPVSIIRKGDYKLIHNYETASYELYNLITDISEITNLLSGSPDQATLTIANGMSTDLQNHLVAISAPLPTFRSNGQTVPLPYIISTGGSTPNSTAGCQAVSGYQAYWDFDRVSAADDASGNANHPTAAVAASITYDAVDFKEGDQAVVFAGTDAIQYATNTSSPNTFLNAGITARTVMAWVKPSGLSGIQNLYDEGGKNRGIAIRLNGAVLETIVRENNDAIANLLTVAYPNDGHWHHVALVYDGAGTSHSLYLDGSQVATSTAAPSALADHFSFGGIGGKLSGNDSFENAADAYFTGKMDAFAVYNLAVSLQDIQNSACIPQQVVANAGPDVSICEGDSTTLTATGGTNYVWSTGATTASITVNPNATTTYTVTVSDGTTSATDSVTVTVNTVPIANAGADVTIDQGNSTTLTATGGGTYLWSTGATTASITVSPASTTLYTVTVSQNGCSTTDNVQVTVNATSGCTYSVLNTESFETGWGIWNDGGSDAARDGTAAYATTGSYSMRLRDNTTTSVGTTDNLDLTIYDEITVDFGYYCRSMDNSNEDFWLQLSTDGGASYTTVEEWNFSDEFVNDVFYTDLVIIPGPFTANTRLRFRADASGNQDWVYIDDVVISGCSSSGSSKLMSTKGTPEDTTLTNTFLNSQFVKSTLYPNPFTDKIKISVDGAYKTIEIQVFNSLGQTVFDKTFTNAGPIEIPTAHLKSGQYHIKIRVDGKVVLKKAIKK